MSNNSPEVPVIPFTNLVTQYAEPELPFTYPAAVCGDRSIEDIIQELSSWSGAGEESAQRSLSQAKLVLYNKIAATTDDPDEHDRAARAFTRQSIALHGQPDSGVVHTLMRTYQARVEELADVPDVDKNSLGMLRDFYAEIGDSLPTQTDSTLPEGEAQPSDETILAEIEAYHQHRYGNILDLRMLDEKPLAKDALVTPEMFREITERSIGILALGDKTWDAWKVAMVEGNSCGMYAGETLIRVGQDMPPAPLDIAKDLLAHELLVHALSFVNGTRSGNEGLTLGLPGSPSWTEAQEGIGCSTGPLPERTIRRYGVIGLALGQVGRPRSYEELRPIELAWQKVSSQASDKKTSEAEQQIEVGRTLRRVFKGRGDDLVFGNVQPVYTKDHIYYTGYRQILDYITALRNEGESMEDIFSYLTAGMFHPYNKDHRATVKEVTGKHLWPKSFPEQ